MVVPLAAQASPVNPHEKPHGKEAPALVRRTAQGALRGSATGDVVSFKGVPYAAPPVGSLRWMPPQAAPRWHGVRDATSFASPCVQASGGSEDCLYLNVYAPAHPTTKRLPVMVWIHGGAFVSGAGSDYDPSPLVARGDVIVVTLNYRLGLLGALSLPELDSQAPAKGSGAYSLLDQQAAMGWVQHNIGGFGGDRHNVTIFGESAGATYTCLNVVSPTAHGLFRAAISESGCGLPTTPKNSAAAFGSSVAAQAGCAAGTGVDLACLRARSPAEINAAAAAAAGGNPAAAQLHSIPVVGGPTLPRSYDDAVLSGQFNHVPMVIGTNHDEGRLFVYGGLYGPPPTDAASYAAFVQNVISPVVGKPAAAILAEYPGSAYPSYTEAASAVTGDSSFSCLTLHEDMLTAPVVPVYAYQFTDPQAPSPFPGSSLGATHGTELAYLFDNAGHRALTPAQQQLSNQMIDYWTGFARHHRPSGGLAPRWPRFVDADPKIQNLAPNAVAPHPATEFAAEHHCGFWNSPS